MMRACFRPSVSACGWSRPLLRRRSRKGEMRLYIQQLEERVRQLTGENERLAYELNQLRARSARPPRRPAPEQTGAVAQPLPQGRRRPGGARPARPRARRPAAGSRHAFRRAGRSADRAGRRRPIRAGRPFDACGRRAPELVDPTRPGAPAPAPGSRRRTRRWPRLPGRRRRPRRSPARRATNTTSPTATS